MYLEGDVSGNEVGGEDHDGSAAIGAQLLAIWAHVTGYTIP